MRTRLALIAIVVLGVFASGCTGSSEPETTKEDFAPKPVPESFKNSQPGPNSAAAPPANGG